jgi:hypothetical protein
VLRSQRVALALAILEEIEKAVSRTMTPPEVSLEMRNIVLRDRIAHAVRIYCANEIAMTIGNTGSV